MWLNAGLRITQKVVIKPVGRHRRPDKTARDSIFAADGLTNGHVRRMYGGNGLDLATHTLRIRRFALWSLQFGMVIDAGDRLHLDTHCDTPDLFQKIRLPKRPVISRPSMASEGKLVVVHLITESGRYFECKPKTYLEGSDVKRRIVSSRFIGPEIVLITFSIRPKWPLRKLVLYIVKIHETFEKLTGKI